MGAPPKAVLALLATCPKTKYYLPAFRHLRRILYSINLTKQNTHTYTHKHLKSISSLVFWGLLVLDVTCISDSSSLLCCLFLCVSLSPFVEWWTVRCWCWFCALMLILLLAIRRTDCFLCPLNTGTLIFLSTCRGHELVPQGKFVHLSNSHNNYAGVSVQPF